ncbi:unnamed protein product [Dibothriocephalus latus]|uniref:Uncharacterized protein n=1 Tax=Dibothriocephalus latus TaxID=60516 RepID=A0A3P7P5G9_DIBLA|nr:unnamed protein product [Dibothriocephalus latus]
MTPHQPVPEIAPNAPLAATVTATNDEAEDTAALCSVDLQDSDPLNCAVFTLPRRGKTSVNSRNDVADRPPTGIPPLPRPVTPSRRPGLGQQILARLTSWQVTSQFPPFLCAVLFFGDSPPAIDSPIWR